MAKDSKVDKKKEILQIAIDKVQMSDAWIKNKYGSLKEVCSSESEKNKIYYPNMYLSTREAPDLKGSEAWDTVTLVVKAYITSHSLNDRADNKEGKKEDFCLDIHQIGVIKK